MALACFRPLRSEATRVWRAAVVAVALLALAQGTGAAEWAQWRGPNRDGKSPETGLLRAWPEGGPRLIWTVTGIGYGYSTVTIKDDTIYTTGILGSDLLITALDPDGNVQRRMTHGPGWADRRQRPGARAIPTIDGDRLYLISGHCTLVAFSHTTGDRLWEVDLVSAFGAKVPMWGYAESVLIDGDTLICTPGGSKVGIVALNKYTGEPVWKSPPLDTPASYASPIMVEFGGVRQVVNLVQSGLVAVEANSGRFFWRYGRPAPPNRPACSNALYANGCVFAASGYNIGGGLVKLGVEDGRATATEVWDTKEMVNHHGGMVLVDGYIYGNHEGGWSCLDFGTGEQQWYADGVGKGSVTYADGMLYCLSEKGTMGLVRATPEKHDLVSTFAVPSGGEGPYWAHPVVCGGRLYVRHADALHAYDIAVRE